MPRRERDDPRRDPAYLLDMLVAARAVALFVIGRTWDEYAKDLFFRSAVERQVEIIGEAARNVSKRFKAEHPEIQWRAIMAQRHRLSHEYGEIDNAIIWAVATIHVPKLIAQLAALVPGPTSVEEDNPSQPDERESGEG